MLSQTDPLRVGYVLKRFPRFSETFILNELLALQELGAEVEVFSLLKLANEPRHPALARFNGQVTGLAPLARAGNQRLLSGLAGDEVALTELLGKGWGDPLFSGRSPADTAALFMKASAVALRAHACGITHLHAHFGTEATTVALLAARLMGGSFSFTAHARDIYHRYADEAEDREMRRAKLREAAFVVTVSDYNADYLRQLCPEAAPRILRLYNGVNLHDFPPRDPAQERPGRLIAVGRLVEKKGFPVLIEACALLRARGVEFDLRLVGDGAEATGLRAQVARAGLQDHITMEGALPQDRLATLMGTSFAAILPCIVAQSGDRDGLPTVLLEAMARALPVITTTVSGGPEIVEEGRTGLLCQPGDPAALADAIEAMLARPEEARQMGLAGRARAESLFDLHRNVARLHALLRDPRGAQHIGREAA